MLNLTPASPRRIRGQTLLVAGLVALLAVACGDEPTAPNAMMTEGADLQSVGVDGQSVTGSGHVTIDGAQRTFAVSAKKDTDGAASGLAQLVNEHGAYRLHAAIDCVAFHGNLAVLSGVTMRETGYDPGESVLFAVEDNGQGSDSPVDRITLAYVGGPPVPNLCELAGIPPASLFLSVERGNIDVRD
jgi:hypothetical protein